MEKQRKQRKSVKFTRFLKYLFLESLFVLFLPQLFSQQRLTYSIIRTLSVKPVNEVNFSGTDCAFELKIPFVKSDVVQAQIPDLPSGVNFVSLRRSEYSDKEVGTKIEIWLNFAEAKTYNLRSMQVYINNRFYYIPFDRIEISDNPKNMLPQLVVSFDNGVELVQLHRGKQKNPMAFTSYTGQALTFTVYLKYAVQIISFDWKVPKNALFTELERYDITKGTFRNSEFSEEKIPVATFELEPLTKGRLYLPEIRIIATSYNGTRIELTLPDSYINVLEGEKEVITSEENYFAYAFTEKNTEVKSVVKNQISQKTCEEIARLRIEERNDLPFGEVYKKRVAFEKENGIFESSAEPTRFSLWLCLAVSGLFLIMTLIFIVAKKIKGILAFSVLLFATLVLSIVQFVRLSKNYAIFKGGSLSPVPEESVDSVASIESGKRVELEQKAGGWVYVEFGSTGGWVLEDNVVFIK